MTSVQVLDVKKGPSVHGSMLTEVTFVTAEGGEPRIIVPVIRNSAAAALIYRGSGKYTEMLVVKQPRPARVAQKLLDLDEFPEWVEVPKPYELPSGGIKPGEDPIQAASRELYEETGYRALKWKHLLTISPASGSTEQVELVIAREPLKKGSPRAKDAHIHVEWMRVTEAYRKVMDGEITNAPLLIGVQQLWAIQGAELMEACHSLAP